MEFLRYRLRGAFALKLALTAALVVLGDVMFFQMELYGGAFGLYGLAMLGALAAARPAVIGQWRAVAVLALAALYAAAMLYSASALSWILFWIAACVATLLPGTSGLDDGWRWLQRLLFHVVASIPGPVMDMGRRAAVRAKRPRGAGGLRQLLPVIVLPVIGSLVFLGLFAAANPIIERWLASLNLPQLDARTLFRSLLWLVLIWMAWSLMRPRRLRRLFDTLDGRGDVHIPGVSPASVTLSLITFNVLFLAQNAMDAAWLWGLVPLPEGITLAGYAHRGAYPLIATALLAAVFVLVTLRPGSTTAGIASVRALVTLWIGQNLFLVFNAALRTIDYIEAYSLTVLRISALLWMGLVALGLLLVLWRMMANKSAAWLINANLGTLALLLTAVCFVDLGAFAAQWNVRHAKEAGGRGTSIDLCYLNQLGGSALLPLIELEQRKLPAALQERVHIVRLTVHHRLIDEVASGGWDWTSQRRLDAASLRLNGKIGRKTAIPFASCDGERFQPPVISVPAIPDPVQTAAPALTTGAVQ